MQYFLRVWHAVQDWVCAVSPASCSSTSSPELVQAVSGGMKAKLALGVGLAAALSGNAAAQCPDFTTFSQVRAPSCASSVTVEC